MLITGTSEKIQVKLSASATTPLPFTVDYNNYTSSAVTLVSNNGSVNSTTAADLVGSPAASQQNQLRYCSLYNADGATAGVKIQSLVGGTAYQVFQCSLKSGGTLQYQLEKGWEVLDPLGNKQTFASRSLTGEIKGTWAHRPAALATNTPLTTQIVYVSALGRADIAYTSIDVLYNIGATGNGITWAEMAIYSSPQRFASDQMPIGMSRRGFTNVATVWGPTGTLGIKKANIAVTGVNQGDLLFLAMGTVATTGPSLTTQGWTPSVFSDLIDSNFFSYTGNNGSMQPSKTAWMYPANSNTTPWLIEWQGT